MNWTQLADRVRVSALVDALEVIGHAIGVVHIPLLDNIPPPPEEEKEGQQEETQKQTRERPPEEGFKDALLGADTIEGNAKAVKVKSELVNGDNVCDAEWNVIVKTGDAPKVSEFWDCEPWHHTDDEALAELQKESDRENYRLVRGDVIDGLKNTEIAEKYNRKIRWAETHAGRVRAAFRKRIQAPTVEGEEREGGNIPQ